MEAARKGLCLRRSRPEVGCPMTLVSIVVTSFERREMLRKAIDSALAQTYEHTEVVVSDGGSADGTRDLLVAYGDRVRWISAPDAGEADGYNRGLEMAAGDLVCFLPSDDLLQQDAVERVMGCRASADPGVAVINGDAFLVNESDTIIGFLRGVPLSRGYLLNTNPGHIIQSSTFFRTSAVRRSGGWDPSIRYGNDFDLLVRVLALGRASYLAAPLSSRRRHGGSLTVAHFRDAVTETHRIRRRHGGELISRATYEELLAVARPALKRVLRIRSVNG